MKNFTKDNISYGESTKTRMAIYSLVVGLFGMILGLIITIMGMMEFLGYRFIPLEIQILRNHNLASIIAISLFPELGQTLSLLEILTEIFPFNKAFLFVWATPITIFDIIKPDVFLGIILMIIGIIYLTGVRDLMQKKDLGVSHLVVGSLLSAGFGIIYFLILIAHGALFLLGNEDFLAWNPLTDFNPILWVSFLSIPGVLIAWQIKDVK